MPKATAATPERRLTQRHTARKVAFCYVKIRGNLVIGPDQVRNVSMGGVNLVLDPRLGRERVQAVQFYSQARQCWAEHEIRTAYLFSKARAVTVGAAFTRKLSEAEVQELL